MPKLIAEGLTKEQMERAIEMSNTNVDPETGRVGPMLSWQSVGMRVGNKSIL
jgi:hypothetical protein